MLSRNFLDEKLDEKKKIVEVLPRRLCMIVVIVTLHRAFIP